MKADDPKFTAHALGELEDLTPAERAEIEALLASDPTAAAEATETQALAARLRAELSCEVAAALQEEQRAAVLQAVGSQEPARKVVPFLRRANVLAALAACVVVGISIALIYKTLQAPDETSRRSVMMLKPAEKPVAAAMNSDTILPEAKALPEVRAITTPVAQLVQPSEGTLSRAGAGGLLTANSAATPVVPQKDTLSAMNAPLASAASALPAAPLPSFNLPDRRIADPTDFETEAAGKLKAPVKEEAPFSSTGPSSDILRPQGDRAHLPGSAAPAPGGAKPGDPNAPKPPTEITALEATFDQRANVAVFIGNVFVKDPQFTVDCDKLTAFLKHDDKPAPGAAPKAATPTPKPATPNPTTGGTPIASGGVKKQAGGLDKAIAVTTSERRVKIIQDKVEADGSITHGIGLSDRAEYFATNGDIFLYGMPDVTQGTNRCIATAPETWMKMNRDGRMEAHGPHKTIIVDTSDRDSKSVAK